MSELSRQFYMESITSGNCVRLEPLPGFQSLGGGGAGTGISAVIFETTEAAADVNFWGTVAACTRWRVIVQRTG